MDVIFTNTFIDDAISKVSEETLDDILYSEEIPHNKELKLSKCESYINYMETYMKDLPNQIKWCLSFVKIIPFSNAYVENKIQEEMKGISIDLYPFVDYYGIKIMSDNLLNLVKDKLKAGESISEIPVCEEVLKLITYFDEAYDFINTELLKRLVEKGIIYHHLYSKDKLDTKGICNTIEKELIYRVTEIGKGKEDLPISITLDPANGVYLLTVRDKYGWLDITISPSGDILVYINSGEVYEVMEYGDAFHYSILIENDKELFNNLIDLTIGRMNEFNLEFKDESLKTKISV